MSISVAKIKVSSVRRTLPKIGRCKVYFEIAQFIDMLRGASDRPLRRLMKPREEILISPGTSAPFPSRNLRCERLTTLFTFRHHHHQFQIWLLKATLAIKNIVNLANDKFPLGQR